MITVEINVDDLWPYHSMEVRDSTGPQYPDDVIMELAVEDWEDYLRVCKEFWAWQTRMRNYRLIHSKGQTDGQI